MVVGGTPTTANKSSYNKIIAVVGVFTDDKVPMSSTVRIGFKTVIPHPNNEFFSII